MFSFRVDARIFDQALRQHATASFPGACRRALQDAGKAATKELSRQTPIKFDRPNPFTRNAFTATVPKKVGGTWEAFVAVKDLQARYLAYQVYGGVRVPGEIGATAWDVPVPGEDARKDQYGWTNRSYAKRMARRRDVVYRETTVGGRVRKGLYQRAMGGLKALVRFVPLFRYRPIFPFHRIVEDAVKANLRSAFSQRFREAMRRRAGLPP